MNRNHMSIIPIERWARARWLEENLDQVLGSLPMDSGMERLAAFEAYLFPPPNYMPLDPTCPECGVETEDGTVESAGDLFHVTYDCGHTLELTRADLQARLQPHGRAA
jgi:lysyl-tRNA synthetase class I